MRRVLVNLAWLLLVMGCLLPRAAAGAVQTQDYIFWLIDEHRQPVVGVDVTITPTDPPGPAFVLTTNADGKVGAALEIGRWYKAYVKDALGRIAWDSEKPYAPGPPLTIELHLYPSVLRVHLVGDCGPHTPDGQIILRDAATQRMINFTTYPAPDEQIFTVEPGKYLIELGGVWHVAPVYVTVGYLQTVDTTIVEKLRNCPPSTTVPPATEVPTTVPVAEAPAATQSAEPPTTEVPTAEVPTTQPPPTAEVPTAEVPTTRPPPTTSPPSTTVPTTTTEPSTTEPSTTEPSIGPTAGAPLRRGDRRSTAAGIAVAGVGGVSGAALISALVRARLRALR